MDLFYITDSRIPTEKANGYQISKMCSEYAKAGFRVKLIVPVFSNPIKKSLFDFYHLERNFSVVYRPFVNLVFLNNSYPHILFAIRQLSFILFLLPVYLFVSRKNKIIFTRDIVIAFVFKVLGYFTVYEAHMVRAKFKNRHLKMAAKIDRVIANSTGTATELKKGGVVNVASFPNGVDLKDFELDFSKEDLRIGLNLPLNKKIAMYAGHFYDWKGTEQILTAAEKLFNDSKIIFVLIGGNHQDINRLSKEIEIRGLKNVLLLGLKERHLIPSYLKSADLLLLTLNPKSEEARYFTSPVKLFEYLAAKVPVIAADTPAIRNLVSENEVIFYQPENSESLAQVIVSSLNKDCRDLVDNGYGLAQKYTWPDRAQKSIHFLNNGQGV